MIIIMNVVIKVRLLDLDKMKKTHFLFYLLINVIINPMNTIQKTNVSRL